MSHVNTGQIKMDRVNNREILCKKYLFHNYIFTAVLSDKYKT